MVAREKSMGYAPVNVKDTSGNRYTLSSQMHFFEKNGIFGPDIILDDSPYHGKNIVHPDWAEMYFCVSRCLILQSPIDKPFLHVQIVSGMYRYIQGNTQGT